jgi:hypothetical protein
MDRIKEFMDSTLPIEVELRVYTTNELLKMAKEKMKLIQEMVSYGKLLTGNEEILSILKKYFKKAKNGYINV